MPYYTIDGYVRIINATKHDQPSSCEESNASEVANIHINNIHGILKAISRSRLSNLVPRRDPWIVVWERD